MKICILTSGHDIGDVRVYHKEIRSLQKKYDEIVFVGQHATSVDTVNGVKILGLPVRSSSSLWKRFDPLIQLYKLGMEVNADVYHCHEPDSLLVGWLIKRKTGKKLIYDSHEYHPEQFAERFPRLLRKAVERIIRRVERYLARNADYVVTVCDELLDKFVNWGCRAELIANYPSGEWIAMADEHRAPFTGVWVGGMYRERGLFEVVDAYAILVDRIPNLKLKLVGWGNPIFVKSLTDHIRSHGLEDHVELLGKVPQEEIPEILQTAGFGIIMDYPIERNLNTIALKLYEYMAASLPVVANDLPATRDLVNQYHLGFLADPLSPTEIAEAIENLVSSRSQAIQMGQHGYQAYQEHFSWQVMERKLLTMYETIRREHNVEKNSGTSTTHR